MRVVPERLYIAALLLGLAAFYGTFTYQYYGGGTGVLDASGQVIGRDFVVFWTASILALGGQVADVFDLARFHGMQEGLIGAVLPLAPWQYPPHALLYFLPLGLLSYGWALALWSTATLALYLLAATGRSVIRADSLVLALAPASFVNIVMGQTGFLSAALLIGGLRLVETRPILAGVLFGLLTFKPQLGLLVPVALVAARLWRPFLSAAATTTLLVALSMALFGVESWQAFFDTSAAYTGNYLDPDSGWSHTIVVTPYMAALKLGLGELGRYAVQAIFALCAILGVYFTFRNETDRRLRVAVLLAAALLAGPYALNYDMTVVSVAALWGFQHARASGFLPGERLLIAIVWLLPLLVVIEGLREQPVAPLVLAAYFALLLAKANGWLRWPSLTTARRDTDLGALQLPPEGRAQ